MPDLQGASEGVRQGIRRCALRGINACAAAPQLAVALRQAGVVETLQVKTARLPVNRDSWQSQCIHHHHVPMTAGGATPLCGCT